jgi:outer membrane protein assembly factor BamB
MAELQDVLQRRRSEIRPEPGAFERLRRRRDRRRRIQAVSSAVLALIVAGIAVWGLSHAFERRGSMPASRPIRPDNVARLKLAWSTPSTGANAIEPPASRDEVYVTGSTVRAYPRTCAAATCGTRWVGDRGGTHEVADVAVGAQLVFIASGDDLSGFPKDCGRGGASCPPVWRADPVLLRAFSSVEVADGVVYAEGHDLVEAFPERCALTCKRLWWARIQAYGGRLVALGGGLVFVQDQSAVKAFRSSCRSDGGLCKPLWKTANSSFGSQPVYSDGRVYVTRGTDEVAAYRARCDRGEGCRPETVWRVPDAIGIAVSDRRLYVTTTDSIVAFDTDCSTAGCPPLWRTRTLPADPSIPSLANGLLFFTAADRVYGLPADCGSGGAICSPVWSERIPGGPGTSLSPPTVTERAVYVVSAGGTLYSFEVRAG